jgi:transposase
MLGRRSGQRGLFEGDHLWIDHVGRYSFYGVIAAQRDDLFDDDDFAEVYDSGQGRPSIPPSLLATALLLQLYDGISDEEARQRASFDARWKVALGLAMEEKPFSAATLRRFRERLLAHPRMRQGFVRGIDFLRRRGYVSQDVSLTALEALSPEEEIDGQVAESPRRSNRMPVTEASW